MVHTKLTKITLTIPTEQRDWLKDHPEIDTSKLLQKAIRNQMMKDALKVQHTGWKDQNIPDAAFTKAKESYVRRQVFSDIEFQPKRSNLPQYKDIVLGGHKKD